MHAPYHCAREETSPAHQTLEDATVHRHRPAAEATGAKKWDGQTIVMNGEVYQQESGFFNMIYHWDPSLFSKFNSKTFGNYETILHGNSISTVHDALGDLPEQEQIVMNGINSALNEDYDKLKGIMKTSLDSLAPYVVK